MFGARRAGVSRLPTGSLLRMLIEAAEFSGALGQGFPPLPRQSPRARQPGTFRSLTARIGT